MKPTAPHLSAFSRAASKSCKPTGEDETLVRQTAALGGMYAGAYLLLTDVGHESDDIVAFIDEPCEDGRGV